jgi:RNA recognition motif-containing protein
MSGNGNNHHHLGNPEDELGEYHEEGKKEIGSYNARIDKNETGSANGGAVPAGDDPDERSIFVKNVHFSATVDDLKEHFSDCGEINRVTIPVDKMSGKSKG